MATGGAEAGQAVSSAAGEGTEQPPSSTSSEDAGTGGDQPSGATEPPSTSHEEALLALEGRLSEQGFGPSQALLLLLTSLVTFTSGLEIYLLSLIGLDMQCDWHISPAQAASLFTVVFMGKCVGEPIWGSASDAFGRRPVILLLSVVTAAAAVTSALSPSYWWFVALRFLFGFALPVDNIVIVWLLELLAPKHRGTLGSALGACWVCASMSSVLAAALLLERNGWRILVILAAVPAVISAGAALAMPESPLWLASIGQHAKANEVVDCLQELNQKGFIPFLIHYCSKSRNPRVDVHAFPPPVLNRRASLEASRCGRRRSAADATSGFETSSARPWKELRSHWGALVLSLLLTGLLGVGQSSANLLPQQTAAVNRGDASGYAASGLRCTSTEEGAHLRLSQLAYRGLLLDALGGLPGLVIGVVAIDRLGRLATLGVMQILAIMTWVPLLLLPEAGAGTLWLTSSVFVVQWWYTASLTVNNVWQVEIFPTAGRSLGVALNGIMGNLGNVISPYLTALLVQDVQAPRLVVATLQVMGALSTGLVGLALWDGLETLGHSTCTMARPSKIYRAMSLRPSVSSTLQRCMWDITDDEVGYGGERSSALSSVEEGGASGDGQSYTARRQVANLSPPGDSPTTAHCELQQPLLQH